MNANKPVDINSYIEGYPEATRQLLNQVRAAIREMAPTATEKISYGIPTFDLHGNLVHFAAFKNHIGFYPGAGGIKAFEEALSGYQRAKGSVQFPLNQPMPLSLIQEIVRFRVRENEEKAALKKGTK
ncbi:iron chaperone [Arsenicibacter rosenii]|uniref:YdhG-like domain-containing protein n=1 Tax=Arsenicibacter rosenii TaxID=1750698 RepID=A0A1S2VFP9_9BACT|nr:DUF1801 domain-containing protein [Arsenicibacter rosenii]OIN57529.1 hypothetical protein BLX24_18740 [Arsenicibacter rosenii]